MHRRITYRAARLNEKSDILADIGIDFGTSKTTLFAKGKILLEQPSVAAVETDTWEPICYGDRAMSMVGRTPESVTTVFPIENGVIADYDIAEQMLREYMQRAFGKRIIKPRVMISVPIGVTPVQHRSVADVAGYAGGRDVCAIESPIAAALALGIDFTKPDGNMVVDIGAGVTDIAAISMGGIVQCGGTHTASLSFDDDIIKYVRREYNILIGQQTASRIKEEIGCATERPVDLTMSAKGRDAVTGIPAVFEITSEQVREAINGSIEDICKAIHNVIETTKPDLVADIMDRGILLTGGGAQLFGLDKHIGEALGVPVIVTEDPSHDVVRGELIALKRPHLLKNGDYQFRSIQELMVE